MTVTKENDAMREETKKVEAEAGATQGGRGRAEWPRQGVR